MAVSFGVGGILAQAVKRCQLAALHGVQHVADVPALLCRNLCSPGFFKLAAQRVIFNMLEAGQPIWDCAHVTAALHVVLSAQRTDAAAVSAHVAGKQRQIDQRHHVVNSVVVLGDSKRPAELRAASAGIRVRHLLDGRCWNSGFALGVLQRELLHVVAIGLKSAGGVLNKFCIRQAGIDNFTRHGVGQINV